MHDYDPHKKNGTITVRVMCAIVFMVFTFLWLYDFQADVLAIAQHVLSGGQTHYDRTIGAVIITLVLQLLQLGVYSVTRLARRTHALTYLPSMLLLTVLSDIPPTIDQHFSFGAWTWIVPLVLLVWAVIVWLARHVLPFENDDKQPTGLFSRRMWLNLLQMVVMMLVVALVGNSNSVFHFSAHAESSLLRGDDLEALRVGERSLETDENLTMLRIYALGRRGELGDRLFDYPIVGTSADMLPLKGSHARLRLLPVDSIWKSFGARPVYRVEARQFLHALSVDSVAHPMYADYILCGQLIDRDLNAFAKTLPQYYPDSLPIPRYYREALELHALLPHDTLAQPERGTYRFYYYN
ncbi:MAG: hypothetical protein IJV45_09045 [Prevotella sp.]|nr:hypothetical protein [Prevotella sp.]